MDTESIKVFVEVARYQSFAACARALQLPTSNVSHRIQRLEQELQVKLFHRTTRHVRLTDVGLALLDKAQQLLLAEQQLQEVAAVETEQVRGQLRITAPGALARQFLGPWLIEFKQRYPALVIELISSNQSLDFYQYQLDFAFRQGPLPDSSLHAKALADIEFGLFAHPVIAEKATGYSPVILSQLPCVCSGADGQARPWPLYDHDQQQSLILQPPAGLLLDDAELVYRAVVAGLGVGYLATNQVAEDVRQGRLQALLRDYWPQPSTLYLVHLGGKVLSAKQRAFIDFIVEKSSAFGM